MSFINKKKEILFLILLIFFFKLYHLYLNPIEHGFVTSYSANTLIFYNAKSFLLKAQSFNDWNHPGTPIYYFVFLISKFIGGLHYENFTKYVFSHNILTFLIYILSINYFFNYFKKIFSKNILIISILFFHSFYMSLHTLEFIDPTNYLIPFGLILTVQTFKVLSNEIKLKNIIKFSLILTMAMFTKLSFLPFAISCLIPFILKIFQGLKILHAIKNFLFLIFSLFIFTILWNLPIIGRIPKILYMAVFSRDDTLLNFEKLFTFFNNFFIFFVEKKFIFLVLILITIIAAFLFYIKSAVFLFLKKIKLQNRDFYIFIFGFLLFLSFNYTLLNTSEEYELFNNEPGVGDLLRNCFHYSLFLIPFLYFYKNKKNFLFFFNILVTLAFLNNLYFYEKHRLLAKKNLVKHEKIFFEKTDKYLLNKRIAIFSNGYPYGSLILHHIGNNIFAGERFTDELNDSNPDIRFLRVADIYDNINKSKTKSENTSKLKSMINNFDDFLKRNIHNKLYLFLSPNSFRETSNFIGFVNRNKDLFISNEKVDYIVFNSSISLFKRKDINISNFISYLKTKKNFSNDQINKIKVLNDVWYLIELDK